MAKVRIARELLEKQFWSGAEYKVRIVGASYDPDGGFVELHIEGDGIPKRGYVRPLTITRSETEVRPD
jgi:hypothetical protein